MKNILLILSLCLVSFGVTAQSTGSIPLKAYNANFVAKATPDTTTNTDTTYLANVSALTSSYDVTYQVTLTNVSGTSTGTITTQGSDDGVIWYSVTGSTTEVAAQTLTVSLTSAATMSPDWKWPTHFFAYYRVRYISGGTQTSVMVGKAWLRKRNVITSLN